MLGFYDPFIRPAVLFFLGLAGIIIMYPRGESNGWAVDFPPHVCTPKIAQEITCEKVDVFYFNQAAVSTQRASGHDNG